MSDTSAGRAVGTGAAGGTGGGGTRPAERRAAAGTMMRDALRTVVLRELRAVKRSIEAYPDDAAVWTVLPHTPNTGGTLALHIAGNLQHFYGAILARDGYRRERDAEFGRRGVPRAELIAGLDAAMQSVDRTLAGLDDAALDATYPEPIANRRVSTADFLLHLTSHLAYHLGQMDYHRRAVTGDAAPADAVAVRELPERS